MRKALFDGLLSMLVLILPAGVAAQSAEGADATSSSSIYEWVDESGRKHAADTVPDRYKSTARRLDPKDFQIAPAAQAEAERQAETLKNRAAAIPIDSPTARSQPMPSVTPGSGLAGKPPSEAECKAWRQRYVESRECFVGTVNRRGKSSYRSCANEYVADPEPVCGR